MTYEQLESTYKKVRQVIKSCKTDAQLISAISYARLFLQLVPRPIRWKFEQELTIRFKRKQQILRLKRHGS